MPSTVIADSRYDDRTQRLFIRFRSGAEYLYEGVAARTWNEFKAAPSKGAYFSNAIRDRHPFKRLDED